MSAKDMRSYQFDRPRFLAKVLCSVFICSLITLAHAAPTKKTTSSDLSPAPTTGLGPAEGDFINETDAGMISEIEAAPPKTFEPPAATPNPKTTAEKLPQKPAQQTASAPKNTTGVTSDAGTSAADGLPLEAPVETVPDETTGAAATPAPAADETLKPEGVSEDVKDASEKVAEEPTAPIESEDRESSSVSTRRYRRQHIAAYDKDLPTTAFFMHGSMQALGEAIPTTDADYDVRNFGFGLAWMPKALQSIGAVSIGGSYNIYPILPLGGITTSSLNVMSFGADIQYQLHYWTGQPIVPFIGYEWQQFKYKFTLGSQVDSGWTLASGMDLGVHFLLNWIEPSAAHEAYYNSGIRRSYLTMEWKQLHTDVNSLDMVDHALYFGLRVEY